MANGFQQLGDLLGGGLESARETAYLEGQGTRARLDHISAQTQEALERAKLHQLDGKEKQRKFLAKGRIGDAALAMGIAKTAEEATALGDYAMADLADLPQMVTARGGLQEQGNRDILADASLPLADRLAAGNAIKGEATSPFMAVPGEYIDARDPTLAVNRTQGNIDSTNARLITANRPVNAPKTPDQIRDEARAKAEGAGLGKRTLDLPQAKARFISNNAKQDTVINRAEKLAADEELWKGTGLYKKLSEIPGTQGARIRAQLRTLVSQLTVQAVQDARDLGKTGGAYGNTNAREWEDLGQSFAALNTDMHPDDLRAELAVLVDSAKGAKQRTADAFYETYPELRQQAAPGAVRSFNTEAEAEAANLAPGTKITIGGRSATWQ